MDDQASNEANRFRPVNPMLGTQPKFGPVPSEHLIPWFLISFSLFFLCDRILRLEWFWTILMIFWGCATWWILTGSRPWKFLSKFVSTPTWSRGMVRYRSIFDFQDNVANSKGSKNSKKSKKKPHRSGRKV